MKSIMKLLIVFFLMSLSSCSVFTNVAIAMAARPSQTIYEGPDLFGSLPFEMKEEVIQYLGYWDIFYLSEMNQPNRSFICDYQIPCREFKRLNESIQALNNVACTDFVRGTQLMKNVLVGSDRIGTKLPEGIRLENFKVKTIALITKKLEAMSLKTAEHPSYYWNAPKGEEEFLKNVSKLSFADKRLLDLVSARLKSRTKAKRSTSDEYHGSYYPDHSLGMRGLHPFNRHMY